MYNSSELALYVYSQLNRFWHNLNHLQSGLARTRIGPFTQKRLGLIRIPTPIKLGLL